jgi:hypothetical protein
MNPVVLASDLIQRLQDLIKREGDLPVGVMDEFGEFVSPDTIEALDTREGNLAPRFICVCEYV